MKKKSVTIKDVAKMAGVSSSTVSRVISNNSKISSETTKRVLKCMEELGYYPNAIARSLVSRKSDTIGVIMPSRKEDALLNPFFPEALRGITAEASNTNYDILISTTDNENDKLETIKKLIRTSKVDSIILMSSKINDLSIDYLVDIDFPFSIIGSPYKNLDKINHVDNDNYMAAYELTRHLTLKNKKNIAIIAGDKELMVTKKRVEGYKKALEESFIKFNESIIFNGPFSENAGFEFGSKISDIRPMPDAIIISDDLVAFAVTKLYAKLNIKIPHDIAIASFNNSILSQYADTPITSVDINPYELGREAMKLSIESFEMGIRGKRIITEHSIYKRRSTEG